MTTKTQKTRPEFCTDEMLEYLDRLRASGTTNMFGAGRYLEGAFPVLAEGSHGFHSSDNAQAVLLYWMDSFGKEVR